MTFSDELRAAAAETWQAQLDHPFVRGIGDGTVDMVRFRRWVRQDYRFLVEYCRLFAIAAARAPDLATLVSFAELLLSTATTEMSLHRSYAAQFGISDDELEAEEMATVTRAYTDFLLRTATLGDFCELASALLPCMWGFSEIGQRLAERGRPDEPRCAAWIDAYADPAFARLAGWCRELVNRLAEDAGPVPRQRMRDAFVTSSRYELAFWDV
jgi:thiaminase/transcriptional activator TenA